MAVGENNINLTHLFFPDNSIFFGDWTIENVLNLVRILYCFQKMVGLYVNLDKSFVVRIGKDQSHLEAIALVIGCKSDKLPMTFLGLSIRVNIGQKKNHGGL